jgi:hypothetical protein
MVLDPEKPGELQGKRATTRICEIHVAAGNSLHGKEGVDGSSPSEGFDKGPGNRPFSLGGQLFSLN